MPNCHYEYVLAPLPFMYTRVKEIGITTPSTVWARENPLIQLIRYLCYVGSKLS